MNVKNDEKMKLKIIYDKKFYKNKAKLIKEKLNKKKSKN